MKKVNQEKQVNLKLDNKILHQALEDYLFDRYLSFDENYDYAEIVIHHISYESTMYLQLEVEIRIGDGSVEFKRIILN
jgi:hypothetical protein